jgi:hypothetical protein
MRLLSAIFLSFLFVWGLAPGKAAAQSSPQTEVPADKAGATPPIASTDQDNAHKARALIAEAIQALGGQAYLEVRDMQQSGRAYSFFHGRPTSNGVLFWRFTQFPDKERIEITKERDIAQIYNGDKAYEVTYKGPHPMEPKDVTDYLRRRRFSLDTLLRTWVNDPTVALLYEGNAIAAEHPALQVTLINSKNESVTLYFDTDSHLPIKKTFSWRDPVDKQRNLEEEIYDNYRPVQGVMTPYGFTRYYNGDMASQRFVNTASYNQGLDPAMFDPNSGYNPNKPSGKH